MTLKSSIDDKNLYNNEFHKKSKKFKSNENIFPNSNNYLKIWKECPSFRDVNTQLVNIKITFIGAIIGSIIIMAFLITNNMAISISMGVITFIIFIISFPDELFSLSNFMTIRIRGQSKIKPFSNLGSSSPSLLKIAIILIGTNALIWERDISIVTLLR